MRTPALASLALAGGLCAVVALGCGGGERPPDEAAPDDTTAVETAPAPAEPAVSDTAGEAVPRVASGTYPVFVENPMPHAMIVRVELPDGEEIELGTVPGNGMRRFRLPARAGQTVTLVAHDEAETHRPTTSIVLPGEEARWTIE